MTPLLSTDRPLRFLLTIALPIIILSGMFYLAGKTLEVRPPARPAITGYGEGKVAAKPDTVEVTLGVQTGRQPTADRTMDLLTQRMDAILKELKAQGIEEKDITTTGLYLYPAYDWIDGQQVSRGFEASENVIVTVRDITKAGETISVATKAGANQVTGVRFYIQDITALRRQARTDAIAKAKEDAEMLANDMGVRLGRLAAINEASSAPTGQPYMRADGMGGGGGGVPVPAGEQELLVSVTLTYEVR